MHDVVVIAVRKAVRAATITFTATSTIRFFICTLIFLMSHRFFNVTQISQISQIVILTD